jgi:histidinol phosphatase-like enzyme
MDCDCRKPRPGLILRAADELRIDLASSWMMGDGIVDIQAGMAAGLKTILLTNLKLDLIEKYIQISKHPPGNIAPEFNKALFMVQNQTQ